jgi:hypothetical protein
VEQQLGQALKDIQNYNFASCFVRVGTWSLTLREERRLWVLKNRMLGILEPKRDEVKGDEKTT